MSPSTEIEHPHILNSTLQTQQIKLKIPNQKMINIFTVINLFVSSTGITLRTTVCVSTQSPFVLSQDCCAVDMTMPWRTLSLFSNDLHNLPWWELEIWWRVWAELSSLWTTTQVSSLNYTVFTASCYWDKVFHSITAEVLPWSIAVFLCSALSLIINSLWHCIT